MRLSRSRAAIVFPLWLAATLSAGLVHGGDPPKKPAGGAPPSATSAATALPITGQDAEVSAAAEALFEVGRDLMKDKKYSEACPKLKESLRLDPAVGTML